MASIIRQLVNYYREQGARFGINLVSQSEDDGFGKAYIYSYI